MSRLTGVLRKHLSATFGVLLDATGSFEMADDEPQTFGDKAATWKLAYTELRTAGSGSARSRLR